MGYVPLLLLVGCGMISLAVVMLRLNAADRRRFRGAVRATGEVVEINRMVWPETARIQFPFRGHVNEIVLSAKEEDGAWYLGYGLGDRVRLLVPPHSPQDAVPADEVRSLYGVPAGVGLIGLASLGFGLLLLTGSLLIAGPIIAAVWVGGFGLLFWR